MKRLEELGIKLEGTEKQIAYAEALLSREDLREEKIAKVQSTLDKCTEQVKAMIEEKFGMTFEQRCVETFRMENALGAYLVLTCKDAGRIISLLK